ncbi:MAG: phosphocholine cytidylyltransferase family protein [Methylococcales bacterium]|nr:phosphocholine cytidylyltransferase family protein [Methylococcales bacterium]
MTQHAHGVRAIILSAGQGRRLLPHTENSPKCLLKVAGKSVLAWQIDTLLAAGITDVRVITGFHADLIETLLTETYAAYPDITACYNPFFDVADNLASCWVARPYMDRDFIILNGDTLITPPILDKVLNSPINPITLTVDFKASYDDDDMKVQLVQGKVENIGKTLKPEQTDAESIGMIYFRGTGPDLFSRAIHSAMRNRSGLNNWYLKVIDTLAKTETVIPCSIAGDTWCEIDDSNDLEHARQVFGALTTSRS